MIIRKRPAPLDDHQQQQQQQQQQQVFTILENIWLYNDDIDSDLEWRRTPPFLPMDKIWKFAKK